MPLKAREGVLKSFRDSKIGIFRTLFQVFKRLICVLYFSFAERGTKNPTWDILDYHPENTVNPNPKEDDPDDQILKKIVRLFSLFLHPFHALTLIISSPLNPLD